MSVTPSSAPLRWALPAESLNTGYAVIQAVLAMSLIELGAFAPVALVGSSALLTGVAAFLCASAQGRVGRLRIACVVGAISASMIPALLTAWLAGVFDELDASVSDPAWHIAALYVLGMALFVVPVVANVRYAVGARERLSQT